jgi:anti-sigma B factor antagonist
MTAPATIVRFHQEDRTATFKVDGRATMHQSSPVRRQAEASLAAGVLRINVDLRDCLYMDSTFLGTLIILNKQLGERQGRFSLIAPSQACSKLLRQMGLDDYLSEHADAVSPTTGWVELPAGANDSQSMRRTVEQAHQELASLPGKPGAQFEEVMRCLNRAAPPAKPDS